jgi:hypothetical protein
LVISSKEWPLVSGMSHATRTIVNKAPPLKSQKSTIQSQILLHDGKGLVSQKSHQPERGGGGRHSAPTHFRWVNPGDDHPTGYTVAESMAHARNPSAIVLTMPVAMHLLAGSLACDGKDCVMPFLVKRVVSVSFLTLAFLYCSASCGRQYEAKPTPRTSFAYVQNGCVPTDAPALEFYFTLKQSQFGKYEEPFVMISIKKICLALAHKTIRLSQANMPCLPHAA